MNEKNERAEATTYEVAYIYDTFGRAREAIRTLDDEYNDDLTGLWYIRSPHGGRGGPRMRIKGRKRRDKREQFLMEMLGGMEKQMGRQRASGSAGRYLHIVVALTENSEIVDEMDKICWTCGGIKTNKRAKWIKNKAPKDAILTEHTAKMIDIYDSTELDEEAEDTAIFGGGFGA
jgi:hypothetical protein|tara:strand:+ start:1588 stop:2112 length:525 start_codon:yes stop_codon:yes gene_type:complete